MVTSNPNKIERWTMKEYGYTKTKNGKISKP